MTREEITPDAKTVRVRVAVVVLPDGNWAASGWDKAQDEYGCSDADLEMAMRHEAEAMMSVIDKGQHFWLEATLPLPTAPTVEGEVKP